MSDTVRNGASLPGDKRLLAPRLSRRFGARERQHPLRNRGASTGTEMNYPDIGDCAKPGLKVGLGRGGWGTYDEVGVFYMSG